MSAGFAAADVAVSGSARMGVVNGYNSVTATNLTTFSSRVRMTLTGSGTTDGGLAFGGSFGVHDNQGANAGTAGSTFISGAFGKIAMGDVDSGDAAAVGQLASVGYTGLGSTNSINYAADGFDLFGLPALAAKSTTLYFDGQAPVTAAAVALGEDFTNTTTTTGSTKVSKGSAAKVLYTYAAGGLTFNASAGQISNGPTDNNSYGLGVAYTTGGLTLAAGYGSNEFGFVTTISNQANVILTNLTTYGPTIVGTVSDGTVTDASLSATYVMGDTTIKAIYQDKQADATYSAKAYVPGDALGTVIPQVGNATSIDVSAQATSMGLSVSHKMGALTLTAFGVSTDLSSDLTSDAKEDITFTRSGIGASYDLGGGASLKAGAVRVEAPNLTLDPVAQAAALSTVSYSAYDVGVTFAF